MEGVTLELNREPIKYTTMNPYERDPNWTYTDRNDHAHDASLETLEWIVTRRYWCEGCRDEHEEGEYRCRLCGEVVATGSRYVGHAHYLPGLLKGVLTIERGSLVEKYWLRPAELQSLPREVTQEWVDAFRASREPDMCEFAAQREP